MSARSRPVLWWAAGVALLALLARLALVGGATAWVDSPLYERIAGSLVRGEGFSGGGTLFGDAYRMPGYPVLIALARLLPGDTAPAVGTIQHLAGVAFAAATVIVGARFFGLAAGAISGLLVALAPLLLYVEHALLPDFAFAVLLAVGVAMVAEAAARQTRAPGLLAGAGAVLACAVFMKPNGIVLFALAPATFLLARRGWRASLHAALVCGAVMGVALAPWVLRNWARDGTPALTTQAGAAAWVTAYDYDRLPMRPRTADERAALAAAEHARALKRARGLPSLTYAQVFGALRARGLTPAQASALMSRMARRAILAHPGAYLSGVGHVLDMHWHMAGDAQWGVIRLRGALRDPPGLGTDGLTRAAERVAEVLFSAWWVLTLGGLASLALLWAPDRRARAGGAAIVAAWGLVAFSVALTNTVDLRYVAQIAPLAWTGGVAGTLLLGRTLYERITHSVRSRG